MKKTRNPGKIKYYRSNGSTLVELIIVMAVIAVISTFGFFSLFGRKGQTELANTTQQMVSLLRDARNRSVLQASSTSWGVHFDNTATPFYALFYSQNYSTSTVAGYYKLQPSLSYVASSIPAGSSKDIVFSQLSGQASVSTSISIYLTNSITSSTINVALSGTVSF